MVSTADRSTRCDTTITLDKLTVRYRSHCALHQVSGSFAPGSLTAVIGPNGAGKSTLLKSLAGLLPLAGGAIHCGVPRPSIAYLPQLAELDRTFPLDVRDCVLLGLWGPTGAWGGISALLLARVEAALQTVGLQDFARRTVGSLSSGQLQRALFARLLVQDADVILLDEPFNAIDAKTTEGLLALVQLWHQQGRTVVAVLHDEVMVHAHFPQALLLARERVAWGPTAQVLTAPHLARARAMAEAWDADTAQCEVDTAAAQSLRTHWA
jgi:zinc/manganese transport system ATP-binding protein